MMRVEGVRPAAAIRSRLVAFVMLVGATAAGGWLLTTESQAQASDVLTACPADAECVTIHTATGDHIFTVEWAIEPDQRSCGLMFREEMAADHGMIFDFEFERQVSFWMRNTLIPLDMIFIRADGEVANIAEFTTPLSLEGVPSDGPVRYVLELNGGVAGLIGLRPGDMITVDRAESMTEGTAICFPPI